MSKFQKLLVVFIVIFTFGIRLVALDKVPPSLSNDEISIAYDSYSILHTGHDEHNNLMPVSFQSHGTYKAPFYIYLASVSNYFLGNSEFSVRLPSVIFGSLTVFVFGYLTFLLSNNVNLSILAMGVLSSTPWHIYTSRMALESNVATFLLTTAMCLFFKYLRNKQVWFFLLSMIFFGLSIWGYHTEWVLSPMIMVTLAIIYRKELKINPLFLISILIFFALVFPIASNAWANRNTNARANTETIFKGNTNLTSIISTFANNYSDYTRTGHLFFDGLSLLSKEDPYTVGLFLLPLLPFFLGGLFIVKKYFPNNYKFIYTWLLISPVVPSLTIGGTNLVRNLATVLPYSLVIASGIYYLKRYFTGYKLVLFVGLIMLSFFYFSIIYFYHFPFQMGENFQYGYKQAAEYISQNYNKYDRIVVDPRFGDVNIYVGVPHLYLAYFTRLDPYRLLERHDTKDGLFFDKYQITSINWNLEKVKPKTLYLVPFDNKPNSVINLRTVKEIKLPNYKVEFYLLESF